MSPSSAAKTFPTDERRPGAACHLPPAARRRTAGSGLVIVMIVICVLSVIAGSLLLTTVTRYHTTYQSASWQEAIVASEAGVDIALNELRKRVVQGPSASFQTAWTIHSPATGKAYPSFGHAFPVTGQPYPLPAHGGEGSAGAQVRVFLDVPGSDAAPNNFAASNDNSFISQLDNPNLRDADGVDRSRWWYRIRSLGIAGVSGPSRPNIDRRDNHLRRISFFTDWRTGLGVASPQAARLVEAVARPLTNFRNALMANTTINLSNLDVLVDSYDSSKGLYSATNQGSMGNIATNGQLINANNATVKGNAMTNNGAVQNGKQISGEQSATFYQELTPLTTNMLNPAWAGVTSGGTITTDASYTASTDSTNPTMVRLDGINLPDGATLNVSAPTVTTTIGGKTTVTASPNPSYIKFYVQGDISTTGASQLTFAPNVNAIVFFTGNVNLQGNGIFNDTMLARNLVLNGVQPPANKDGTFPARSITVSTYQDFEGIIYAPDHDLVLALQAVPATGSNSSGEDDQKNKQVDKLNKDIDKQNQDYGKAMNDYAKDTNVGSYDAGKAAQDLQKAAQAQANIKQDQQQIALMGGSATASQTDDHSRGYNGIYGGFVAKSILVQSKTHVHYDETLRNAGPVNHYEVTNWFEDNLSHDGTSGAEQFWWPGNH